MFFGSERRKVLLGFGLSNGEVEFNDERVEAYVRSIDFDAAGGQGERSEAASPTPSTERASPSL